MRTEEEANALRLTEWWIGKSAAEIVVTQIDEQYLCMPFNLFHAAAQEIYGERFGSGAFFSSNFRSKLKNMAVRIL